MIYKNHFHRTNYWLEHGLSFCAADFMPRCPTLRPTRCCVYYMSGIPVSVGLLWYCE